VNKKQLACLPHVKPENGFLDRKTGWRGFTGKALAFV
jgi:hypothetical protein